jgi:hypothetical protein
LYAPELGLSKTLNTTKHHSAISFSTFNLLVVVRPTFDTRRHFFVCSTIPITADEVDIYLSRISLAMTPHRKILNTGRIYAMSRKNVRYSPNPRQQTINAMLVGSNLPEYQYLEKDTDLIW